MAVEEHARPSRIADIDDVGEASALATEIPRDHDTQQALRSTGGDRLLREARIAIDDRDVVCSYRGDACRAGFEVRECRADLDGAIVVVRLKRECADTTSFEFSHSPTRSRAGGS